MTAHFQLTAAPRAAASLDLSAVADLRAARETGRYTDHRDQDRLTACTLRPTAEPLDSERQQQCLRLAEDLCSDL